MKFVSCLLLQLYSSIVCMGEVIVRFWETAYLPVP